MVYLLSCLPVDRLAKHPQKSNTNYTVLVTAMAFTFSPPRNELSSTAFDQETKVAKTISVESVVQITTGRYRRELFLDKSQASGYRRSRCELELVDRLLLDHVLVHGKLFSRQ